MWESSLGIIVVIGIMFGIGLLASPSKDRPKAPRQTIKIAIPANATIATNLNIEPDSKKLSVAQRQAYQGVSLERPPEKPLTPAEKAAVRGV